MVKLEKKSFLGFLNFNKLLKDIGKIKFHSYTQQ